MRSIMPTMMMARKMPIIAIFTQKKYPASRAKTTTPMRAVSEKRL